MLPIIVIATTSAFLIIAHITVYYNSLLWKCMSKHKGKFWLVMLLLCVVGAFVFGMFHGTDVNNRLAPTGNPLWLSLRYGLALTAFLAAIAFYRYISSKQWRWLPLSFFAFLILGITIAYIAVHLSDAPFMQTLCSILFFLLLLFVNHAKPVVLVLAARDYYRERQFDIARDIAYEAAKIDAKYMKAHLCFADACLESGLLELAEMGYMKALSVNRNCNDAHWGLGKCYKIKGMFNEALAEYSQAKREAVKHYSYGFINAPQNINWAIVEWRAASANNFAPAHNVLADAYFSLGMHEEAIAECQKAISINPTDAHPHYVLGLVYSTQGNSAEAIRELEEAEKLNSNLKAELLRRGSDEV